ncbi:molybdate ABC transporter substrate-binding protein [Chachezhania sediminis]|uniref:molybdate ABC transporter substrate-binding protein n=1 Tax=Chachezhania sediminis TaxID=2599291 RepID=UPI00131E3497|nr:molybdate ABC transporter substrate-binding protein [Chachezhania sediminis]
MIRFAPTVRSAVILATIAFGSNAMAGETTVAVAANFTAAAQEIGTAFQNATDHSVTFTFGSTGQLYTQITQAAPFDVFLAADQVRPELAETDGFAVPGSRFTYAEGQLVLWSADPAAIDGTAKVLESPALTHVAIANPATAPYGAAAVEVLQALNLYDALLPKLVEGKSISQTHQFVATGNAQVGFVALSQVIKDDSGSDWLVPAAMYKPIRQDAVLLKMAEGNEAAAAFIDFLQGPEARAIIESYGYRVGE